MSWKRAIIPALLVLPLLFLLATRFGVDPRELPSVLVGKPAPAFALVSLDGEKVSNETLAGRPYVLNFWSTWCVPCKLEHDVLQQASRRY